VSEQATPTRHLSAELIHEGGTSSHVQRVEFFPRSGLVWIRGNLFNCDDVKEVVLDGERHEVREVERLREDLIQMRLVRP
jgi:MarR-like DNA-binding transcriptional regulator SgrR of sgrS sRNA